METAEYHLGNAIHELQQGHARTALDAAHSALRIQPESGYAHAVLAVALTMMGEETDAREALQQATEQAPRDHQVRYYAYLALGRLGDMAGARAQLTYFTQLQPGNTAARQQLVRMGGPVVDLPPLPRPPVAAVWYDGSGHSVMDSDQIAAISEDGEPPEGPGVILCPDCDRRTWKGWVCKFCGARLPVAA
jgi:tetratricopeptide (TPR) repeat protein